MPRAPRIIIPGIPHHVTQRGNNREDIFLDDIDRNQYLSILRDHAELYDLQIHGYCLMDNHVHLVVTPSNENSLPKSIGTTHRQYSQYFNRKYNSCGHLWHSRYFSCPLDDNHFMQALIYVDRNPVRAGLVDLPWEYKWSSAATHLGRGDDAGLVDLTAWESIAAQINWKTIVTQEEEREKVDCLRRFTESGYPLGHEDFLREIEEMVGYPVRIRPRGRPGKK